MPITYSVTQINTQKDFSMLALLLFLVIFHHKSSKENPCIFVVEDPKV